jgi:hypothetical protein
VTEIDCFVFILCVLAILRDRNSQPSNKFRHRVYPGGLRAFALHRSRLGLKPEVVQRPVSTGINPVADRSTLVRDVANRASLQTRGRICSSFDLQNLPVNHFIGLFEASSQIGRNRALQVRSPVGPILRIPQG